MQHIVQLNQNIEPISDQEITFFFRFDDGFEQELTTNEFEIR